jgi:branched-chain amino acid aminotransferase
MNPLAAKPSTPPGLSHSRRRKLRSCTRRTLALACLPDFRMKIYIDGKFLDAADAKVSVFDHGLLYGDGVFEGIRAYHGRIFKLKEHIDRLFYSAKAILLNVPLPHAEIMKVTVETCRQNNIRDGYIRLLVTRGPGGLGLNPNRCKSPSVIVIADTIQLYPREMYERGLELVTVPTTRNLHSAINPAIKSLNYLNNILAKIEANIAGCEEAIMLNAEGYVAECTGDNIFIVKAGQLLTPPLAAGALYGITRQTVLDLARQAGIATSEPNLTRYDLFNADECFLTGTGAEIIPVVKIDGRTIGHGKPGPITQTLEGHYKELAQRTGEPI